MVHTVVYGGKLRGDVLGLQLAVFVFSQGSWMTRSDFMTGQAIGVDGGMNMH